ncbi:DNA repair protein rad50 [Malassezia cuniculi]|uniref:DNA repair protein RAD50 n=1 Tax=Malassezia cuniculi TaxID=948313 RepID=A0AAF0EXY7_9BASI|nr:DNA repair protein rad50 [Malassezia cuniculi]
MLTDIRDSDGEGAVSKKKDGGLTMKTLEGVLGVDDVDTPQRSAISTRCAELDAEMPLLLGVSKAILDYVLFCHQEDSQWPLAEPAVLKARFDDIFDATRYRKALDHIRALRKQRAQDARVDDAELKSLQQDRERASATKSRIRVLREAATQKQAELDRLEEQISVKTRSNKDIYDKATRFRELISQAETLEERRSIYAETCKSLEEHMVRLDGTVESLERELADLPRSIEAEQHALVAHKDTITALRATREARAREHERILSEQGDIIAAQRALERTLMNGAAELERLSETYGLSTVVHPEAGSNIDAFRALRSSFDNAVVVRRQQHTADTAKLRAEYAAQLSQLSHKAQSLRDKLRDASSNRAQHLDNVHRIEEGISAIDKELRAFVEAPDHAPRIAELRESITKHTDELNQGLVARTAEAGASLAALESRRDELTRQVAASTRHAEQRAARAHAQQQLELSRARLDEAIAKTGDTKLSPDEMSSRAADRVSVAQETLSKHQDTLTECQRRKDRLGASRDMAYAQQNERSDRAAALDAEATNELGSYAKPNSGSSDAEAALEAAQEEIGILRDSVAVHASLQRSQPERVAELQSDLEAWSEQQIRFERALEMRKQAVQLRKEAAAFKKDVSDADEHLAKVDEDIRIATQEIAAASNALDQARAYQAMAVQAKEALAAFHACEAQLAALGADADIDMVDSHALDNVTEQIQQAKQHHASLLAARDAASGAVAAAEKELFALELSVARAREKSSEHAAAQKRRAELAADMEEHRHHVLRLDKEIQEAEQPAEDARAAFERRNADREEAERAASEFLSSLEHCASKSVELGAAVDDAVAQGLGERMDACAAAIATAAQELTEANRALEEAEVELSALQEAVHTVQARASNLRDNLRYRKTLSDMAAVDSELDQLNLEDALQKHNQFAAQYDAARQEENEMNGKASHMRGELQGIQAQIASREQELVDDYRDIEERYTQKQLHIRVGGMANQDLDKYCAALQHAILQFHSIKMEEINQTLDYLWKKTYQGTDIDTILIRTEADGRMTVTGMRSYQYRVCMVKDGAEMDMRGRCSAGQKVLACILIRLALADSFSSNTGFLALDEPTTNLDRENVEALAESVIDLIAERRHQCNFQLIVITHDEDFLSRLAQSAVISQYWRVSRDANQVCIC